MKKILLITTGGTIACIKTASGLIPHATPSELLKEVDQKSEYIVNSLSGANGVKSVSGLGLMLGIETEKDASEIINYCRENGVLVIKAKSKVRLLPALNIPFSLLEKAVDVIKKGCAL